MMRLQKIVALAPRPVGPFGDGNSIAILFANALVTGDLDRVRALMPMAFPTDHLANLDQVLNTESVQANATAVIVAWTQVLTSKTQKNDRFSRNAEKIAHSRFERVLIPPTAILPDEKGEYALGLADFLNDMLRNSLSGQYPPPQIVHLRDYLNQFVSDGEFPRLVEHLWTFTQHLIGATPERRSAGLCAFPLGMNDSDWNCIDGSIERLREASRMVSPYTAIASLCERISDSLIVAFGLGAHTHDGILIHLPQLIKHLLGVPESALMDGDREYKLARTYIPAAIQYQITLRFSKMLTDVMGDSLRELHRLLSQMPSNDPLEVRSQIIATIRLNFAHQLYVESGGKDLWSDPQFNLETVNGQPITDDMNYNIEDVRTVIQVDDAMAEVFDVFERGRLLVQPRFNLKKLQPNPNSLFESWVKNPFAIKKMSSSTNVQVQCQLIYGLASLSGRGNDTCTVMAGHIGRLQNPTQFGPLLRRLLDQPGFIRSLAEVMANSQVHRTLFDREPHEKPALIQELVNAEFTAAHLRQSGLSKTLTPKLTLPIYRWVNHPGLADTIREFNGAIDFFPASGPSILYAASRSNRRDVVQTIVGLFLDRTLPIAILNNDLDSPDSVFHFEMEYTSITPLLLEVIVENWTALLGVGLDPHRFIQNHHSVYEAAMNYQRNEQWIDMSFTIVLMLGLANQMPGMLTVTPNDLLDIEGWTSPEIFALAIEVALQAPNAIEHLLPASPNPHHFIHNLAFPESILEVFIRCAASQNETVGSFICTQPSTQAILNTAIQRGDVTTVVFLLQALASNPTGMPHVSQNALANPTLRLDFIRPVIRSFLQSNLSIRSLFGVHLGSVLGRIFTHDFPLFLETLRDPLITDHLFTKMRAGEAPEAEKMVATLRSCHKTEQVLSAFIPLIEARIQRERAHLTPSQPHLLTGISEVSETCFKRSLYVGRTDLSARFHALGFKFGEPGVFEHAISEQWQISPMRAAVASYARSLVEAQKCDLDAWRNNPAFLSALVEIEPVDGPILRQRIQTIETGLQCERPGGPYAQELMNYFGMTTPTNGRLAHRLLEMNGRATLNRMSHLLNTCVYRGWIRSWDVPINLIQTLIEPVRVNGQTLLFCDALTLGRDFVPIRESTLLQLGLSGPFIAHYRALYR